MAAFPGQAAPVVDYETLKEQWGEIEDRDGVRLSWNTFPSSRMVCCASHATLGHGANVAAGSVKISRYGEPTPIDHLALPSDLDQCPLVLSIRL